MPKALYQLPTVNALKVAEASYAAVSALQSYTPGEQVAGAALLLKVMSEFSGVSVSELLNKAERIEDHADSHYTTTIRSLREYVKNEVR